MKLLNISSPHATKPNSTSGVMLTVLLAMIPGIAATTYFFGPGHLIQIALAIALAVSAEAATLAIRKKPIRFYLNDYSAVVTAVLLALALPPLTPWWVTSVAVIFAIVIAKHLYGGLGQNPFNPAMVGFALVLVSFPVPMTTSWVAPQVFSETSLTISEALNIIFIGREQIDAYTMATPLDFYKHQVTLETADEILKHPMFGDSNSVHVAIGWEWINLAFLAGGLYLLWRKVFTWHIPVSYLVALTICATLFGWDADSAVPASLHMLAGATMLGAFFIATDPVSASTTPLGKLIYGAGIGIFIYVIRAWGSYPDALAFAVLIMNFAAPFIDQYTQPRTYGHKTAKRGLHKSE